jgi:hypothetical protein
MGKKEMQLMSTPILFPMPSDEDADDTVALVDMEISIDQSALYSIWQRDRRPSQGVPSSIPVSSLHTGKTSLPLDHLRSRGYAVRFSSQNLFDLRQETKYCPPIRAASYGADFVNLSDVQSMEDEAMLARISRLPNARAEQCMKAMMLQRILVPRRVSRSAIITACERFIGKIERAADRTNA